MAENTVATIEETNGTAAAAESREVQTTHEPDRFATPPVDIYEDEHGLMVVADLPGASQDTIEVGVENDLLTIKASPVRGAEAEWQVREFAPTGWFRQFTLSNKIDQTRIEANYKNGVLTVRLPLAEEVKPRQIAVKIG
ncbi:MAG: Hsp20/alpha crystallin family protein [Sumerlaeia bacterium]